MSIKQPQKMENCIGCKLCVLACSLAKHNTLGINTPLRIKEKNGQFFSEVDLGTCSGCGKCVQACPRNCLVITKDHES